ncbi:CueP family metal-binding protein [Microbacterium sp. G2-8]|uniref:CueP family metal-binding protein n=1 Tax=Microbacterium sp. G2-8 TaxID=2842454 RepID=UPI001C891123|nr:CueP family metal-binding protein [Microbacterium sp. G2-8]
MKNRPAAIAALALSAALLAGCTAAPQGSAPTSSAGGSDLLAAWDLDGLDTADVIERLDATPLAERPEGLIASVQPDAVVLADDAHDETRLPMPEDEVYIAVAPFREMTHECHFHSLTTCVGELGGEEIDVTVVSDDGETILDETRTTYDNGFVGVWVPRDIAATVTITHDGDIGSAEIATIGDDDATCITGLQLT